MCKSKAMGGQRCVGHAAQRLARAQVKKAEVETAFASGNATDQQVASARAANWKALVEYASTSAGAEALRAQYQAIGNPDTPAAGLLRSAIDEGALLAQANRRAENEYRASAGKGPLSTPVPVTLAQEAAAQAAASAASAVEQARNSDPLGLRQPAQPPVAPSVPTQPAVPAQASVVPPAAAPGAPRAGLPTRPPATRQSAARSSAPRQPSAAQQRRAEESRRAREEREAEKQRQREERAVATEQAREQRTLDRERRTEARRLKTEVSEEVKAVRKLVDEVWTKSPTAPVGTWNGPGHWSEGQRPSRRENRAALKAGRARYGAAFATAVDQYKGTYAPADVLSACERLEALGRDRIAGRVRPNGWYGGYNHIQDAWVQASRQEAFGRAFGPSESQVIANQFVAANLNSVLWNAKGNRPRGQARQAVVEQARRVLARVRVPLRLPV